MIWYFDVFDDLIFLYFDVQSVDVQWVDVQSVDVQWVDVQWVDVLQLYL